MCPDAPTIAVLMLNSHSLIRFRAAPPRTWWSSNGKVVFRVYEMVIQALHQIPSPRAVGRVIDAIGHLVGIDGEAIEFVDVARVDDQFVRLGANTAPWIGEIGTLASRRC